MTHAPYILPLSPEVPDPEWERLDTPTFERRPRRLRPVEGREFETVDLGSGLIETHLAPPRPRWTSDAPEVAGFYLVRPTGAPRDMWRVVDVYRNSRGQWAAAWSDIDPRALTTFEGFEWSLLTEPKDTP